MMDYYTWLGLKSDCLAEEITPAYRSRAKKLHPDGVSHLGPEAEAEAKMAFQALSLAYDTLRDPALREAYDLNLGIGAAYPRRMALLTDLFDEMLTCHAGQPYFTATDPLPGMRQRLSENIYALSNHLAHTQHKLGALPHFRGRLRVPKGHPPMGDIFDAHVYELGQTLSALAAHLTEKLLDSQWLAGKLQILQWETYRPAAVRPLRPTDLRG